MSLGFRKRFQSAYRKQDLGEGFDLGEAYATHHPRHR
jgi:hypothetical protein